MNELVEWQDNAEEILPLLRDNSLLEENIPLAEAVVTLCQIGQDAIGARSLNNPTRLKPDSAAKVASASERKGDILIQIAPGIQKLVNAAAPKPATN